MFIYVEDIKVGDTTYNEDGDAVQVAALSSIKGEYIIALSDGTSLMLWDNDIIAVPDPMPSEETETFRDRPSGFPGQYS